MSPPKYSSSCISLHHFNFFLVVEDIVYGCSILNVSNTDNYLCILYVLCINKKGHWSYRYYWLTEYRVYIKKKDLDINSMIGCILENGLILNKDVILR